MINTMASLIFSDSDDDDTSMNNPSPTDETINIYKSIKTHIEKACKKKYEKEKKFLEAKYKKKNDKAS